MKLLSVNVGDPDSRAAKRRKKLRAMEDIEEIQERAIKQQKRIQKKQKREKNKIRREEREKFKALENDLGVINMRGLKRVPAGGGWITTDETQQSFRSKAE